MGVVRSLAWAAAFVALGLVLALGLWPGASAWEAGPRYGMATLLLVTGLTVAGFAMAPWVLRRTTKASDYEGGCPVGATCACGHFNFKPRKSCRQCGMATAYSTP